jgi:hypothetical protein
VSRLKVSAVIPIAQAYSHYRFTAPGGQDLDTFARIALNAATDACRTHFDFDVEIGVSAEEASLKVKATVASIAAVLVFYGDLRQSVDQIVADGRAVSEFINEHIAAEPTLTHRPPIHVMRRTLTPGRLQRLFDQVERGELTADEATTLALEALTASEHGTTVRLLTAPLHDEFSAAEQLSRSRYSVEALRSVLESEAEKGRAGRTLTQQPATSLAQPDLVTFPRSPMGQLPVGGSVPGVFLHRPRLSEQEVRRLLLSGVVR